MTALQILEKLGADASFDPSHLSEQENSSIEQVLSKNIHFSAVQSHQFPGPDEKEDEESEDEESEDEEDGK